MMYVVINYIKLNFKIYDNNCVLISVFYDLIYILLYIICWIFNFFKGI